MSREWVISEPLTAEAHQAMHSYLDRRSNPLSGTVTDLGGTKKATDKLVSELERRLRDYNKQVEREAEDLAVEFETLPLPVAYCECGCLECCAGNHSSGHCCSAGD